MTLVGGTEAALMLVAVIVLARVVNFVQKSWPAWQEQRQEKKMIQEATEFLSRWKSYEDVAVETEVVSPTVSRLASDKHRWLKESERRGLPAPTDD